MFTKAELNKKTEAELIELARLEFELEVDPDQTKTQIVAAILAAQDAEAAPLEAEELEPEVVVGDEQRSRFFKLLVHNQEGVDNTPFIKVGVNGTMYQITREKEVVVPEAVVNVLNDAVITRYEFNPTTREYEERKVRRFPYSILGEAV